jgi:hypothetical protein
MDTIPGLLQMADAVLRGDSRGGAVTRPRAVATPTNDSRSLAQLALLVLTFGTIYGGVMGTYGGLTGDRLPQVVYSAIKVPLLLTVTFALSIPSFFVINSVLGLRGDFGTVLRALMATQAGLTVILASLAPLTAFWYVSDGDYQRAILFNGLMFAVASFSAQWMLRRGYLPLIRSDHRHRYMLRTWIFIYVFVGIQMGWLLRPFVGDPAEPVQFFREGGWSNAYVFVFQLFWSALLKD